MFNNAHIRLSLTRGKKVYTLSPCVCLCVLKVIKNPYSFSSMSYLLILFHHNSQWLWPTFKRLGWKTAIEE
jgi:hypothetical protein